MYDSNRCGFCHDFGKKVKPFVCANCWEMIDKFVQAERERCAKIVRKFKYGDKPLIDDLLDTIAKAIRED